jgi:multicomponent Na+:H+ antiporter subunit F
MTTVFGIVAAMLALAAVITAIRLLIGPSTLDRVVALDMMLAIVLCGIAVHVAVTRDAAPLPVLVVVALLGFVGSASIARFLGPRSR